MREWNAETYHRVSNPQFDWGTVVLDRLPLNGDEFVLDVGCGTGRLTDKLLERLPRGRVVALDLSSNMVQVAREFLQPRHGRRIHVAIADAGALPVHEQADAIFSTATFHWVLRSPPALPESFRGVEAWRTPRGAVRWRAKPAADSRPTRSPESRRGVRRLVHRLARPLGIR